MPHSAYSHSGRATWEKEKAERPEKQSLPGGSQSHAAVFALQGNIMHVIPDAVLKAGHELPAATLPLSWHSFRFALDNVHYVSAPHSI